MNRQAPAQVPPKSLPYPQAGAFQRKCACGRHAAEGECMECRKSRQNLQRRTESGTDPLAVPAIVHDVLRSPGQPLDLATRAFMEPRFGHDFSQVRVHRSGAAAESARAVNALAYTVGGHVVFGAGQGAASTSEGRRLVAHELAHVIQQGAAPATGAGTTHISDSRQGERNADRLAESALAGGPIGSVVSFPRMVQRRAAPYIKKVTVHLTPDQTADLEWEGTPPATAPGVDHFTVSTGKGYGEKDDPPGTCTRSCCSDPLTQCAPPWNQPTKVGSCCTYYGDSFWTGAPLTEHNTWKWWTPIEPHYSSRGIALHQHPDVTGKPIGHGCVRMDEPNAKRIHDFSNGKNTNVTIDGRAAPVRCEKDRRCSASGTSGTGAAEPQGSDEGFEGTRMASGLEEPVPGLEGVMS